MPSLDALAAAAFRRLPLGNPATREEGDLLRLSLLCEGLGAGGKTFFLAARTAARLLAVSPATAARRLARLVEAGELELIARGKKNTGKASVYRYSGPTLDDLGG